MKYDFETWKPRINRFSAKYEQAKELNFPEDALPLTMADMEFVSPPEIVEAMVETAEFGLYGYSAPDEAFYLTIANWMEKRHGWRINTKNILLFSGILHAMHVAINTFTKPGDKILIHNPNYPPVVRMPKETGRVALENRLLDNQGQYELDLPDLEAKAAEAKMMIFCSPHNPCGRVWRREELLAIAEICYKHKLILFVDEIHADIIMPGFKQVAFGTLPKKYLQNTLIATSACKTFSLGGLSTAFLFVEDENIRKQIAEQANKDGHYCNSLFGLVATKTGYDKAEAWLEEMLQVVNQNYQLLKDCVQNKLPLLQLSPLQGTYLAWLDCRALQLPQEELMNLFRDKAGLYAANGAEYGSAGQGYLRINLACPTVKWKAILENMEIVIREYVNSGVL